MLLANKTTLTLARRDLFDARFQLISESGDEVNAENGTISSNASALEFLEAPSDLVPGVYEGGLKTWECSLDLVSYLDGIGFSSEDLRNKRILEVRQFDGYLDIRRLLLNRLDAERPYHLSIFSAVYFHYHHLLTPTPSKHKSIYKIITPRYSNSFLSLTFS